MKRSLGWLGALSLLLALTPTLRAEPPPTPSASPAQKVDPRVQRGLDRLRQRLNGLPSALPAPLDSAAPTGSTGPTSSATPGRLSLEELARRWAERASTRGERREQHRAELLREAGQRAGDPQVLAELKLHATRLSDLAHVEFLAENARSGGDRDKLLARVAKLSLKEAARHHARMTQLLAAAPAAPSAAAVPSAATPAPSGSSPGATR